jgi:hypothetical protein
MTEELKPDGLIQGSYTISLDIAGRRVQIGGYIQAGDTKEAIIAKMDEMQDVIDHQLVRADLKSQEGHLKGELAALEALLDDHDKIIEKSKALKPGKRLHPQDEAKLKNFDVSSDHLRTQIQMRKKIIEENKKTLGVGANGSALA